ncbi:hypothetical protein DDZ18_12670 [Marinicauda salina]|uniref:Uncharacterized protein n=1 Tax=Marinicauda salina TaxID=2135793 RepID=A0A2U2BRH9_9PROT|nr:hypothetical protein [Marinicauda salina]PWE16612.1 hypothetical protein DDZ18_12670 [Marinicauda salina]
MPVEVFQDARERVRLTVLGGVVRPEELRALGSIYGDRKRFDPNARAFVHLQPNAEVGAIDVDDLLELDAAMMEGFSNDRDVDIQVAVVADTTRALPAMRLWREISRVQTLYTLAYTLFTNFADAVDWHGLGPHWTDRLAKRDGLIQVL